jgi:TPR repeat protein
MHKKPVFGLLLHELYPFKKPQEQDMSTIQSAYVNAAETKANGGDLIAMELLSRRFFEGRGTTQSFSKSFYWSSIAIQNGVSCLASLNAFALKNLNAQERQSVELQLTHCGPNL